MDQVLHYSSPGKIYLTLMFRSWAISVYLLKTQKMDYLRIAQCFALQAPRCPHSRWLFTPHSCCPPLLPSAFLSTAALLIAQHWNCSLNTLSGSLGVLKKKENFSISFLVTVHCISHEMASPL